MSAGGFRSFDGGSKVKALGPLPSADRQETGIHRRSPNLLSEERGLEQAIVAFVQEDRKMPNRPKDWQKIINTEAEVCHWIAPDGTRHPCTDEENAEVRRELLIMRTISDKRRQQQSEER
jgi:hypothetical protein